MAALRAAAWSVARLDEEEVAATQAFKELLTCRLCQDIFTQPNQLDCNHVFCKACIIDYLAGAGQSQCPTCGVPAAPGDMVTHFQFRDAVEGWLVPSAKAVAGARAARAEAAAAAPAESAAGAAPPVSARRAATAAARRAANSDEGTDDEPTGREPTGRVTRRSSGASSAAAAAAGTELDWVQEPAAARPETPDGFRAFDEAWVAHEPLAEGAVVKYLVNTLWMDGEVAQCRANNVDVKLSSGKTRRRVAHTDSKLVFKNRVVVYSSSSSSSSKKKADRRLPAGGSRLSVAKTPSGRRASSPASARRSSSKSAESASAAPSPYDFHTGDTQAAAAAPSSDDEDREGNDVDAASMDSASEPIADPGAEPAEECVEPPEQQQLEAAKGGSDGGARSEQEQEVQEEQDKRKQEQEMEAQEKQEQQREQAQEQEQAQVEEGQEQAEEASIEEAETQACGGFEDDDDDDDPDDAETLNLNDDAADDAEPPAAAAAMVAVEPAAKSSATSPVSDVPQPGAASPDHVLVPDSEDSEPAAEAVGTTQQSEAAAPSRVSHGSTVTFADDNVSVQELPEAACPTRESTDNTEAAPSYSCPLVGDDTQAEIEDYVDEGDDGDEARGEDSLASEARALRLKELLGKAVIKNDRHLNRFENKRAHSSVARAEEDRPEKQQRLEATLENSSDDVSQNLLPNTDRPAGRAAALLPPPAVEQQEAAEITPPLEEVVPADMPPPTLQHEEDEGQSLLLPVQQSPAADATVARRDIVASSESATMDIGADQHEEEDEHVESSLPMESQTQYTQATQFSQQTPAAPGGPDETPFDVVRETPEFEQAEAGGSQRSDPPTQGDYSVNATEPLSDEGRNSNDDSQDYAGHNATEPLSCPSGSEAGAIVEGDLEPPSRAPAAAAAIDTAGSSPPDSDTVPLLVKETPELDRALATADVPMMQPPLQGRKLTSNPHHKLTSRDVSERLLMFQGQHREARVRSSSQIRK